MKIDELVERLEAVYPWTPEKVGNVLGAELTVTRETERIVRHEASHILYEGLLIDRVHLRLGKPTMDAVVLIFDLSDKAACITQESIRKTYPGGERSTILQPRSLDGGVMRYSIKRPWGVIVFKFKLLIQPDCLAGITFGPEGK